MKQPSDGEDTCFTCEPVSSVNGWLYLLILYIVFGILAKSFAETGFSACNKLGIVRVQENAMIKLRKCQT